MTKAQRIFAALRKLNMPEFLVIQLTLAHGAAPSLTICCTVDRIVHHFHCSEADEAKATELLQDLLKIHFNTKRK
jgi:hypothetical protein